MKPIIHHVTIEVAVLTDHGEDPLNWPLEALITGNIAVLNVKASPYRVVDAALPPPQNQTIHTKVIEPEPEPEVGDTCPLTGAIVGGEVIREREGDEAGWVTVVKRGKRNHQRVDGEGVRRTRYVSRDYVEMAKAVDAGQVSRYKGKPCVWLTDDQRTVISDLVRERNVERKRLTAEKKDDDQERLRQTMQRALEQTQQLALVTK